MELLPGERLVWASDARGRSVDVGEVLPAIWVLAGLTLWLRMIVATDAFPGQLGVAMGIFALGSAVSSAPTLWLLLTRHARESYVITDRRLLRTARHGGQGWWLDRLPEPTVRGSRVRFESATGTGPGFLGGLGGRFGTAAAPALRDPADLDGALRALAAGRTAAAPPPSEPQPVAQAAPKGIALQPWERVLWTGRPGGTPWMDGPAQVFQAVGLLLTAPAILLFGHGGPAPFQLVTGVMALAAVGYPWLVQPLLRRRRLRRTRYVLTDRRLITDEGPAGQRSAALAGLHPPTVRGGSVVLEPLAGPVVVRRGQDPGTVVLVAVADPERVARTVAVAQLTHRGPAVAEVRPAAGPAADDEDGAWSRWI
ncbi:hypothetical protein [Kitasatospora cinereorecta]|uniref:PH domain-containing protein n=1 Tax=Kitasatospora cinereorecta TaxID=285560 RepID=A0ABW0VKB6_9ACTN